ncbi:hypothetical protein ACJ3XI_06555 [Litorimonas sp. RW-G-Af-16]|uniref:hypothetical protein n=1 Tax=Litorimonas sp. RW-G-Af-16 TaxID=3241168 RepID=UPI00390CBBB3
MMTRWTQTLGGWTLGILVALALMSCASYPRWHVIDDFEASPTLQGWTNIDAQNETVPYIPNPQISKIYAAEGNRYMLRKPAANGVVGNRKALGFKALPKPIPFGSQATLYARFNVEAFPNNQSFGLSGSPPSDIPVLAYDAFEPMIRVTDKAESDGTRNNGTLMVSTGHKSYARIQTPLTGEDAAPLTPDRWYEVWAVIDNAAAEQGGQSFDLFMKGGEFETQTQVFAGAAFWLRNEAALTHFIAISNTGPTNAPYGNGGVRYDDLYLSDGRNLTMPKR